MNDRIFVSIAAYRDPELSRTVRDLFARAAEPHKLTVGVFDQSETRAKLPEKPRGARIHYAHCHPSESRGACWARSRVQSQMGSEGYYLQLDAHTCFKPGWDRIVRKEFSACCAAHPILTSYLPGYEWKRGRAKTDGAKAMPMQFSHFDDDGIIVYGLFLYPSEKPDAPQPGRFFSGHFAFARRDFVERVPYDPELYFFGEESTLAARAYTNGFELFHPSRVIAWHHYERKGKPRHWNADPKLGVEEGAWIPMYRQGVEKYRKIFCLMPHIAPRDGLGTKRSLADYEAWAGVDHYWQLAHSRTKSLQPPPAAFSPDWTIAEGLLKAYRLQVKLPRLATLERRPVALVYIVIIDATPRDGAAMRCTAAEYVELQKKSWEVLVRYRKTPLRIVVWPYLENDEWGNKYEARLKLDSVAA